MAFPNAKAIKNARIISLMCFPSILYRRNTYHNVFLDCFSIREELFCDGLFQWSVLEFGLEGSLINSRHDEVLRGWQFQVEMYFSVGCVLLYFRRKIEQQLV